MKALLQKTNAIRACLRDVYRNSKSTRFLFLSSDENNIINDSDTNRVVEVVMKWQYLQSVHLL
uniref:Uncharacterized protein n=1 Tax=Glossina palpalis gambiensis TaxID=67801 RepID=A0A1B0BZJ5_9MUSC